MTETEWINQTQADIARATANYRGPKFFVAQALCLTRLTGARFAFVTLRDARHAGQGYSLVFVDGANPKAPVSYQLQNTPCASVLAGNAVSMPCDVQQQFPAATGVYSGYCGLPLPGSDGQVIGLLAVADDRALNRLERMQGLLALLVGRTAAELECHMLRGNAI